MFAPRAVSLAPCALQNRDAEAIHHHYDVSNRFYEMVLGPSMTYTCACFPTEDATLEEAQYAKYDLVARKLGLQPGMRLLDIGSGWGGMVRHAAQHYGVEVVGVTLSREQAAWAQEAIKRDGLARQAYPADQDGRGGVRRTVKPVDDKVPTVVVGVAVVRGQVLDMYHLIVRDYR